MNDMAIQLLRHEQLSASDIASWHRLTAAHAHVRNAFLSEPFVAALAALNPQVRVAVERRDGQAVAFLAVQRRAGFSGRCGVYEPAGGSMSDCFGLVAAPEHRVDLQAWLAATGIGTLVFTHLEQAQLEAGLAGEQPRIGLRTRIHEPASEYWARMRIQDKKLVGDTERRQRKLEAERGLLRFELHSANPASDLDALIRLKQSQYDRTGKRNAPLFDATNAELLRLLLGSAHEDCAGMLSVLRAGDRLVAAHFGLRCHDMLHFWFPVYDADFRNYAPGRLLLRHVIEAGVDEGIRCIDRGEGDTPAKRDFANEEHLFYSGVWRQSSLRAWPSRLALSAAWRLEQRA